MPIRYYIWLASNTSQDDAYQSAPRNLFSDPAGKWLTDPLKQTDLGNVILGEAMTGNMPKVRDYASDFLYGEQQLSWKGLPHSEFKT